MDFKHKDYMGNEIESDITEFIQEKTSGADYDRGSLEVAQAAATNVGIVVSNLANILYEKKLLTDSEIEDLVIGVL